MRFKRRIAPLPFLIAVLLTVGAVTASATYGTVTCNRFASPNGSDKSPGTESEPFATAQHLIDSLAPGERGCFRAGTYSRDHQLKVSTAGVTLAGYPGEQAVLQGRIWVTQGADGVTIQDLVLDGRNAKGLPSPTVNANDAVFRNDEVTNQRTAICFMLGRRTWGRADRTLIEDNRIHDCGVRPRTNKQHGIYVSHGDYTVIRNNWIYRNADRGIQLYPDAQHTTITGNVIDANGEGIIFSGGHGIASNDNMVTSNLITNSRVRYNVESFYPAGNPIGTGNVVAGNCLWGGAEGNIQDSQIGFTASDNLIADPLYVDRASGDYNLQSGSPCAGI